ncbi:unnamed protein product [Mycena citricolor]|uniref:rRNA adenine N(6)-methyltransferase n=1 Tax=Mycena citricolor TaxID=2018698 RepID=A0AAD2H033_9AGAR|nr:unnamed protein product [Mycena citricolor]
MYLKYLQPLEEVDDRIKVYPLSGELWSSYSAIEEMGVLQDVPIVPWDQGVHPQLQFVSHLTSNVAGEQLISQLLRNIPEKHWLFRYGRVPMSLLMNEYIWNRMLGTKASIRCKLSMIAAATSLSSMAVKADILKPYGDHFHPTNRASSVLKKDTKANLMRPGSPFVGINIVPNEEQVIKPGLMNAWDYCLRHLYVQRATPLEKAIGYLAPGAKSLLKSITSPDLSVRVDPKTAVRDLTVQEWEVLVNAFNQWPFAPEDLSVTDALGLDEERGG